MSDSFLQRPDPVPVAKLDAWESRDGDMTSADVWTGDEGWLPDGRTRIWDDEARIVWFRQKWTVPADWAGRTLVLASEVRNAQAVYVDGREVATPHVLAVPAEPGRTYRLAIRGDRLRRPGLILRSEVTAWPAGMERWIAARDRASGLVPNRGLLLDDWRVRKEVDGENLADPGIDHGEWPRRALGEEWRERNACYWFRMRVAVPDTIAGYPVAGQRLRLTAMFNRRGSIWIDGEQTAEYARDFGDAILAESAEPGRAYTVAIRVPAPWTGWLRNTRLVPQALADAIDADALLRAEIDRWDRVIRAGPDVRFIDAAAGALAPLGALAPGDTSAGPAMESARATLVALRDRFAAEMSFIALPYLQLPRHDGITVRAESAFDRVSTLELRRPGGRTTSHHEAKATRFHRHVLDGLDTDADYAYRLVAGNVATQWYPFHTAPANGYPVRADRSEKLVVACWGDSHYGAPILEKIADRIGEARPDFVFTAGDIVGDGIREYEFIDHFLHPLRRLAPAIAVHSPVGNHDHGSFLVRGSDRNPHLEARFEPTGTAPGESPYCYSVDYGPAHFVFVDPQWGRSGDADDGLVAGSPQYEWLRADLAHARERSRWIILSVHEPPFCETWEGGYYDGERLLRRDLVPLMEEMGVDLCVSGHAHTYERGIPHPPYAQEPGDLDGGVGNTVAYLVTGGGGSALDNRKYREWPQIDIPPHRVVPAEDFLLNDHGEYYRYHYCILTIEDNRLECTAYWVRTDGTVVDRLDSFILRKGVPRR